MPAIVQSTLYPYPHSRPARKELLFSLEEKLRPRDVREVAQLTPLEIVGLGFEPRYV